MCLVKTEKIFGFRASQQKAQIWTTFCVSTPKIAMCNVTFAHRDDSTVRNVARKIYKVDTWCK